MVWLVLLLAVIFLYWVYNIYYNSHQYRLGKDIPGYKPWPIIGSVHLYTGNSEEIYKFHVATGELASQHDGLYSVWVGPKLLTYLTDVNDVETVLNKCLNKPFQYDFFNEVLGSGLITIRDSAEWKRHRKIIQPTFNTRILNSFIENMHLNSMDMVKLLESQVGKGKTDVTDIIGTIIADTLFDTTMDVKVNGSVSKQLAIPITQMEDELSSMAFKRTTRIWMWCDAIFYRTTQGKMYKAYLAFLRGYITKVFLMKREVIEKKLNGDSIKQLFDSTSRPKDKCFLNAMLTDKPQRLTDNEIIEEMQTIFTAGFDTSTISISFALMLIGSHPDVQNKLQEELASIYQGSNRPIVKEDLAQMIYLEYTLKEALRLYPPVMVFGREITTDVKLRNCTLPAGSTAYIMPWIIHRDEKIWGPDASEFKPERWKTTDKVHPCSFIPFSYGARNCIGLRYAMMIIKVTLANILRNFKITADISGVKLGLGITMKPLNGCRIELVKRNM